MKPRAVRNKKACDECQKDFDNAPKTPGGIVKIKHLNCVRYLQMNESRCISCGEKMDKQHDCLRTPPRPPEGKLTIEPYCVNCGSRWPDGVFTAVNLHAKLIAALEELLVNYKRTVSNQQVRNLDEQFVYCEALLREAAK